MPKRFTVELGEITLVELNEPGEEDEIYILGAVEVRNRNGEVRKGLTKYFVSPNCMIFTDAHKGMARALAPQGQVYNEVLDDDDVAALVLMVVEHDAASTIRDINRELLAFIRELGSEVEGVPGAAELTQFIPVAELVARFMNMISNIFDKDDLLLQFMMKYPQKAVVDKRSIPTTMDEGLYNPVTFVATMAPA